MYLLLVLPSCVYTHSIHSLSQAPVRSPLLYKTTVGTLDREWSCIKYCPPVRRGRHRITSYQLQYVHRSQSKRFLSRLSSLLHSPFRWSTGGSLFTGSRAVSRLTLLSLFPLLSFGRYSRTRGINLSYTIHTRLTKTPQCVLPTFSQVLHLSGARGQCGRDGDLSWSARALLWMRSRSSRTRLSRSRVGAPSAPSRRSACGSLPPFPF